MFPIAGQLSVDNGGVIDNDLGIGGGNGLDNLNTNGNDVQSDVDGSSDGSGPVDDNDDASEISAETAASGTVINGGSTNGI